MSPLGFSWGRKGTRSTRKPRTYPKRTWGSKAPRTPTVRSLAQKVQKISKVVKSTTSDIVYGTSGSSPIGNVAGNNVYIQPISQYSTWTRTFGTDADDESNHKALWKRTTIDCQINANGERAFLDYTFFVVSLTKLGMEELFTPATGGLAGPLGASGLTNGTHYYAGSTPGLTLVNKKYFNIHMCKRMRTGSPGSLATDTNDLSKRWMFKIAHNKGKGHLLQNAKGDWKAIPSPQLANQNYYFLIFNNDSTADTSVYFQYNGLHQLTIA